MESKRIFLVEDDEELASLVKEYLSKQSFQVTVIDNGENAVEAIHNDAPDLVILDLMLPGKDGISICRELRGKFFGPIMMLTASDDSVDEIVCLEIGADDYVSKPVDPRILLARIRSLLRRIESRQKAQTDEEKQVQKLTSAGLVMDINNREVSVNNKPLELNTQEFDLLQILMEKQGQLISRDELFRCLKGYEYDGQNRLVDILISQLRHKLDDQEANLIKTVRGKGYLLKTKK